MTDKKDQTEADSSLQEETAVADESATSEEWQSDLPPEDDFHDQGEFQEDLQEDIVDEGAADSSHEDAAAVDSGKRGKGLLFVVMAIGALFIGGLAYLQFGSNIQGQKQAAMPASAVLKLDDLKQTSTQKADTNIDDAISKTTGKVDLEQMFDAARHDSTKTVVPNGDSAGTTNEKPMQAMTSEIITSSSPPPVPPKAEPTPEAKIAKIETIPVIEPIKESSVYAPLPVALGTQKESQADDRVKALTSQMELLKKSLDESMQRNADLTARVETLQKKVDNAAKEAVLADKAKIPEEKALPQATATPAKAAVEVHSESLPTAAPPSPAVIKTAKKAPPKKKAIAKAPAAPKWILRAATPDAVWVAAGADSTELKRVGVGESLPGIGKIKEIRQKGDSWEAVGERGILK